MDSGIVATWIGLGLTVLGMIGGLIMFASKVSERFTRLEGRTDALGEDMTRVEEHNAKQHEELYNSRNSMEKIQERQTTILEIMTSKVDAMDAKIDRLLDRRA